MILGENTRTIALASSKDNDITYYEMNYLKIEDGIMYGTNGHSLYYTNVLSNLTIEEDWPGVEEEEEISLDQNESVYLPAKHVLEISSKIPKKKDTMNILKHIRVENCEDNKLLLSTTDLESTTFISVKKEEKSFPDPKMVIDEVNKDGEKFKISLAELERLVKIVKSSGVTVKDYEGIEITPPKNSNAPIGVRWMSPKTDNQIDGIIMPVVG